MAKTYYFDTSIWLDFFEHRDEPNLPKGRWAHELVNKIIRNDDKIIYSDNVIIELETLGYSSYDIAHLLNKLRSILIYVESHLKQLGKAKDLALKRNVPQRDALHALIARDNKATLVTLDNHFQKLRDIAEPQKPQDLISP
ncbi:PIN domain-containing protein [Candidatus Woesearchaeota archaeon]|nr:PIN domain-containing protein [Candidatus Woesearchaeota archaeon]